MCFILFQNRTTACEFYILRRNLLKLSTFKWFIASNTSNDCTFSVGVWRSDVRPLTTVQWSKVAAHSVLKEGPWVLHPEIGPLSCNIFTHNRTVSLFSCSPTLTHHNPCILDLLLFCLLLHSLSFYHTGDFPMAKNDIIYPKTTLIS